MRLKGVEKMMPLKHDCLIALNHPDALPPTKKHESDTGWDVYVPEEYQFGLYEVKLIDFGIVVVPPQGYYFDLCLRSSLSEVFTITNGIGIIDADYRGNLKMRLLNHTTSPQAITKHSRVGQLILRKRYDLNWIPVDYDVIKDTGRGTGGFGSTGK